MALTRLKNVFTSKTGRCLYVNSDDFDASDAFDNRGNSPNRPFKSIQRALLEAARFSYRSGQYNDQFESFSIVLYPGDYVIDNRPGLNVSGKAFTSTDITELSAASDFDLIDGSGNPNPNNVLYQYNSVEGGVIIPRGTSLIGMDLRKTKLRPLYIPDPEAGAIARAAIFRVTGGCYFWQFSFFDGPSTGVYKDPAQPSASSPPTFSHHKLTCFEYADGKNIQAGFQDTSNTALNVTDLDLYYQKVAKAFSDIPDSTSVLSADELQSRVEENRIVGPNTAGPLTINSLVTDYVSTNVFTTTAEVTTAIPHGFSVGTPVLISGVTGTDSTRFNGSYYISEIPSTTKFRYIIKDPSLGAPSGNPTATSSSVEVEVDNVDSSSPYIFNISLRSTWGTCGMHADGSKATGFKSMVVAQFTGVSLQKDDNAFIKWDGSAYINGSHTDGDSIFRASYRNFHVKASNDSVIQAVSVFAVGFADHFVALSGGDQSITNSNSNFGSCALRAKGFKPVPFTQDKAGTITHIIPPQKLSRTWNPVSGYTFGVTQNNQTVSSSPTNNSHGIAVGDYLRFNAEDGGASAESYYISAVDSGTGALTISKGYRGTTAAAENAWKGTLDEIPVGYVAVDVQKVRSNAAQNNTAWAATTPFAAGASCKNGGKTYYTVAGGTTGSTAPTHTSTAGQSDGSVTWKYIGLENTRLYLYGYNSEATKPPYKLQGYNIGARVQDKIKVSLIDGSTTDTFCALITPDDSATPTDQVFKNVSSQAFTPGDPAHPLQWDPAFSAWYLRVTAATSGSSVVSATTGFKGIHYHLGNETQFYGSALFTGASYISRIPDNRSSRDRTYRIRYEVDSSAATLQRDPINGYIVQPRNVPSGQSYDDVYYIYDIQTERELIKGNQNGIYYCTLIKGSISPSDANVSAFSFSQNINDLYPVLDKDNPTEDPAEATSIASSTSVGLVTTTNLGTGLEDKSLSITKEVIGDWIIENKNAYTNSATNNAASAGYITLEPRDGEVTEVDKAKRMVVVNSTGGTITELRRPSILRSGNHTFEYVGFGPGNYSTGLPSVQNRVLTDAEILLAQSQKEDGGIAFYSGLNSNGDLFIGNKKVSSVTGTEESLDTPSLSIIGETANLRPVFDEIIVRDKLTVEDAMQTSVVKGYLTINKDLQVDGETKTGYLIIKGSQEKKLTVGSSAPAANVAANDGDIQWDDSHTRGEYLGWIYDGSNWVKMGLSDTGNLKITGGTGNSDATGDLQLLNGLGIDIQSTGTLTVGTGATTLGGTLTVANNAEINGTLDVDANFAVRSGTTDKFTVASATGNVSTSGTLTVSGNTTLNGNVDLGNATTDTISFGGYLDTDIIPSTNGNKNLGSNLLKFGTLYCTAISGITSISANVTGNISGNAGTATALETARTIGGVSFDGTAAINLPGVNTAGNQNTSGNAATATQVTITNKDDDVDYSVLMGTNTNTNGPNDVYHDFGSFSYNPYNNMLKVSKFKVYALTNATVGTDDYGTAGQVLRSTGTYPSAPTFEWSHDIGILGKKCFGNETISTGAPSGGSNGDIHYKY